ncbi:MAG: glycosyltransferase family 2 protein [Thermoanaerobaculia bacterium]
MTNPGRPRLSVLLPATHRWPVARLALESLLAQDCRDPYEILVLDGHGGALDAEPDFPVRWIRHPGADVFGLRARGIAEANGEIVAITEDHCIAPRDWCRRVLEAHDRCPAGALVGPVSNHADSSRRSVDRANFLLTLGPFAPPLGGLEQPRLPVPTNMSFKRRVLPSREPDSGWIEYTLLSALRDRGEIGVAPEALLEHRQSWTAWRAPFVHFQSGRSYGASIREWAPRLRRRWFREFPRLPRRILWITRPALERGAGGAPPSPADRFWVVVLILANAVGQLAGALTGPGTSRRRLE